ncbi:MAG: signal peptidase I [Halobacteriaceae archaeon]
MTDLDRRIRTSGMVVAGIALVVAIPLIGLFLAPGIVGAESSYVVLSDSMSPEIQAGDIVVVDDVEPETLERGDIITFRRERQDGPDRITHRIVEVQQTADGLRFWTKGDANDKRDPQPVEPQNVIGSVWFRIPAVGFLFVFAETDLGLVVFLILPGVALVANEFMTVYRDLGDLDQ